MRIAKFMVAIAMVAACFTVAGSAYAKVRIDINNPNSDPFPLAVPVFHTEDPELKETSKNIADVVANNFNNSALFKVVDRKAYLQDEASLATGLPEYADWRMIQTDAVVSAIAKRVVVEGVPKLRVEFRLYDVHDEKQLIGKSYTVGMQHWRHVAHVISDKIYEALTGELGYFATRIVHIGEEKDYGGDTVKKLCVMDQDGENHLCLTDGSHLVLTPRFNPEVQKIIYMSYANGLPRLYLLDLPTGRQEIVGDFEGLNSSPRFAPDGRTVAMTLTKGHEGNPEIYTMDLRTRQLKRLTRHRAIDTSPSFSPDGKKIVFNSDRGGRAALYIMDRNGTNVKRLTYNKGRYYAPVWSPRGDLIAFVKNLNGTFHIGVIDPEGKEERLLTDSFMDESPTWSPNGRVLAFSRQDPKKGTNKIYSIDLTGYNLKELKTPRDASDPAWSPLVK